MKNVLFFLLLLGVMILSVATGSTALDWRGIWEGTAPLDRLVVLHERLPRTLLGVFVGASLSMAGLAFQSVLRNPLADPFIMGVAGGAAVGGTLAMLIPGAAFWWSPGLAFVFALATLILIHRMARDRTGRMGTVEVLLLGVVFNTIASSVIVALKVVLDPRQLQEMMLWLMGSLSSEYRSPSMVLGCALVTMGAGLGIWRMSSGLNAIALGREAAQSVGVDVDRVVRRTFVAASLLVACAVSVAGLIGFVGLIVPHMVRLICGHDLRRNVLSAALLGAVFLVCADWMTRILFLAVHTEAPVGALTSLIGGPLFIMLLRRHMRVQR